MWFFRGSIETALDFSPMTCICYKACAGACSASSGCGRCVGSCDFSCSIFSFAFYSAVSSLSYLSYHHSAEIDWLSVNGVPGSFPYSFADSCVQKAVKKIVQLGQRDGSVAIGVHELYVIQPVIWAEPFTDLYRLREPSHPHILFFELVLVFLTHFLPRTTSWIFVTLP